jgi:hypothetical protein
MLKNKKGDVSKITLRHCKRSVHLRQGKFLWDFTWLRAVKNVAVQEYSRTATLIKNDEKKINRTKIHNFLNTASDLKKKSYETFPHGNIRWM